jgi:hypothetical protein
MYNIIYNPGAGGDMVAAVIDSKDYKSTNIDISIKKSLRYELKLKLIQNSNNHFITTGKYTYSGATILYNDFNKTEYMREIEKQYIAATFSHDFSIELQHITDPILIDDSEYKYAKWCMERCHIILPKFHSPFDEVEIQRRIKRVKKAKEYGKCKVISLKDILEGRLIEKLQQWIGTPLNTEIYNHWLNTIIAPLPKVD